MVGKRYLHRFLFDADRGQANAPYLRDKHGNHLATCDKMKALENARIMTYLYWESRYVDPIRKFHATSRHVGKTRNTEVLERGNESFCNSVRSASWSTVSR
ncbi:hypothetical protein AVEN_60593-1 [Araneus ventricosus]|uniref:Uncharacterized protein n=1 Tax=Araneus ventricosus TaxID=182803 RepID=A0A4Y2EYD6_ARAVE|nr:hypothetical protein AVEN_60593-1 [Araneus ventricosus]